ncbi:hypothetical protein D1AOALGA4SA_4437 [Olavius algarvensis Delta 1 endosymbiont]|nr:hypothetical protein D1AOALGA4SA_4437 [Olavius algarvensis Delta 1 endosymbiont]
MAFCSNEIQKIYLDLDRIIIMLVKTIYIKRRHNHART